VWYTLPLNESEPGLGLGADQHPVAMTQNCALTRSPRSVAICHRCLPSSNTAQVQGVQHGRREELRRPALVDYRLTPPPTSRSIHDALAFARIAGVKHLVPFHHDPGREDAALEAAVEAAVGDVLPEFLVTPAAEGTDSTCLERSRS
jgi:hypothetical protein